MADGFGMTLDPAAQLRDLAQDLRAAGSVQLKRELAAAARRTVVPFRAAVKDHARTDLPSGGGLNVWVAGRLQITAAVRTTGAGAGVRFKTKHKGKTGASDLPAINNGRVRHPLYGNRGHWYVTTVRPGFVNRALDDMADTARAEFLQAVDDIRRRFASG